MAPETTRTGPPAMTDDETVVHLRKWVENPPTSPFAWPTDACGYDQHMRFVEHRNRHLEEVAQMTHEQYLQFVLDYAADLEVLRG